MPDCALLASSSERERGEQIQNRRRTEGADVRLTFKKEQRSEPANERFCKLLACSSFRLLQKNADLGLLQGVHWPHAGPFWASDSPYVGSYRILNQPRKPATSITTGCWTFHAAGPGDTASQLWYME